MSEKCRTKKIKRGFAKTDLIIRLNIKRVHIILFQFSRQNDLKKKNKNHFKKTKENIIFADDR